jgi:3' terminal RNA ribose 2'-O-methyltransferase Hen1
MLIEFQVDGPGARDFGYVLHKHPDRMHEFSLKFGKARVFFPQATDTCCHVALHVDVDPVHLVRGTSWQDASVAQYVNDRPYVASSFMSVALGQVFRSAMAARCPERPELIDQVWAISVHISNVPCARGPELVEQLFAPLGYVVAAESLALDERFPEWGDSRYLRVHLSHRLPIKEVLSHLYVLLPVLDAAKHYWVGAEEVAKLLRHGDGWLAAHPAKDQITVRYLRRKSSLVRQALAQLVPPAKDDAADSEDEPGDAEEAAIEKPLSLNQQRLQRVSEVLIESGATTVCDAGCGEGRLVALLLKEKRFTRIVGLDVSWKSLEIAGRRLRLERMNERQRARLELAQASLCYADERFGSCEALALVEVIEHIDADRLPALEQVVFALAKPATVVVTTPNVEYNACFEGMEPGALRHRDHRFEWTRPEFKTWCEQVAQTHGYTVCIEGIGESHQAYGAPTQMGVFSHD